jgi:hypothetical protein
VKILPSIAAITTLSLPACSTLETTAPCTRLTVASVQHHTLDISFRRDVRSQIIVLHLAWTPPGPPFYTPYGRLQALTLTEGNITVEVPPERISHIEDIWPGSITLRSTRVGSYELSIPHGVPIAVPDVITIRSGRFVGIHTTDSFYPPAPRPQ